MDGRPSRRIMMRAGLAIVVGAAMTRVARAQKIDKSAVMYQDQPKDGHQCSTCVNFQQPNACVIVSGVISPNGWCGAYAPKQG
jgi:High potential iron-sulfur protein